MEKIKIISRNESQEKNSERFEQFSKQIEGINTKIDDIKERYGVKDSAMRSFSPDLLPTHEFPMILSQEVFDDYQRILSQTNDNKKEHNFIWLGKKLPEMVRSITQSKKHLLFLKILKTYANQRLHQVLNSIFTMIVHFMMNMTLSSMGIPILS